ncbi:MAG TPA: hypothetical protein DD727_04615, partial [Clostridiales bacterium]|nr:hypothetical protein [Clostridiales bacterium]
MRKAKKLLALVLGFAFVLSARKTGSKNATTVKAPDKTTAKTAVSGTASKTTAKSTATGNTGAAVQEGTGQEETNTELLPEEQVPGESDEQAGNDEGPYAGLKFSTANIDLQGRTFVFANRFPATPYTDTSALGPVRIARLKKAEQILNFKMEFVQLPGANWDATIINNYISGISMGEVLGDMNFTAMKFGYNGVFRRLDDYVDFTHPKFRTKQMITIGADGK